MEGLLDLSYETKSEIDGIVAEFNWFAFYNGLHTMRAAIPFTSLAHSSPLQG